MRFIIKICFFQVHITGDKPHAHPVLQALEPSIAGGLVSKGFVMRLIEGREEELSRHGASLQFRRVSDLEDFGEKIYSTLGYLSLQGSGIRSIEADHVLSHLGKASYIANVIRGVHFFSPHRVTFLPGDLCAQIGLSQQKLFEGTESKELTDVIYELASRGNYHVTHAQSIAVPKAAKPYLMECVVLERFYERLRQEDFNVYSSMMKEKDGRLPAMLLLEKWKNKLNVKPMFKSK